MIRANLADGKGYIVDGKGYIVVFDAALKHSLTAEGDFVKALERGMQGNTVVRCAPGVRLLQ